MGVYVLTNIEGYVLRFNNHEPKALVQELPLWEKKHKELFVFSTSVFTLQIK